MLKQILARRDKTLYGRRSERRQTLERLPHRAGSCKRGRPVRGGNQGTQEEAKGPWPSPAASLAGRRDHPHPDRRGAGLRSVRRIAGGHGQGDGRDRADRPEGADCGPGASLGAEVLLWPVPPEGGRGGQRGRSPGSRGALFPGIHLRRGLQEVLLAPAAGAPGQGPAPGWGWRSRPPRCAIRSTNWRRP